MARVCMVSKLARTGAVKMPANISGYSAPSALGPRINPVIIWNMGRGIHDSNLSSFSTSHGTKTMALIINRVLII